MIKLITLFKQLEQKRNFNNVCINKVFLKMCESIKEYCNDPEIVDYVDQILKIKNNNYTKKHITVLLATYDEGVKNKNELCRKILIRMLKKLIKKGEYLDKKYANA